MVAGRAGSPVSDVMEKGRSAVGKRTLGEVVGFLEDAGVMTDAAESPWPDVERVEGRAESLVWDAVFPPTDFSDAVPIGDGAFERELVEIVDSSQSHQDGAGDEPEVGGWDRCAWYQPIHWYRWDAGIYVLDSCLRSTARGIARRVGLRTKVDRSRLARDICAAALGALFFHELYHHAIEAFAIRLHVVERIPRYPTYQRGVYSPMFHSPGALEEALANAYTYRRFRRPTVEIRRAVQPAVIEATERYLSDQFAIAPPGYRDALRYVSNRSWVEGQRLLFSQVQEGVATPVRSLDDWSMGLPDLTADLIDIRDHLHLVTSPGATPLFPTFPLYRPVDSRRFERALEKELGYQRVPGGKGSHVKLKAPGRPTLNLPGNRKDLKPGVLRDAAKKLAFDDIETLLRELGL